jgi:uncharacterized protein
MKGNLNRILIDIGHPAQVHGFKHVYWDLLNKGFDIKVTIKEKEITQILLDEYGIPYEILSKKKSKRIFKIIELPLILFRFARIILNFKPTIILCRLSIHSVWIGRLFRIKVIALADSEHTKRMDFLTTPFAHLKLTGNSYNRELGKNHLRFPSNLELLYLHPNRFVFDISKIQKKFRDTKIVILRFISWQAHHDIGESGISLEHKSKLINLLKEEYTILISSEMPIQPEFNQYAINIPVGSIHHYLKFATLYIGEGASMASEAACLGTPAYYINSLKVGYIDEQVSNRLIKAFNNSDVFMNEIKLDLKTNLDWYDIENHKNYLSQNIDASQLLIWVIKKFPFTLESYNDNIAKMKKKNGF